MIQKLKYQYKKWQIPLVVALNGAVIMILELTGSRILAPHFGSTLYVWTSIIGVIMICLSIGYWYGGQLADAYPNRTLLSRILLLAAVVLLVCKLLQTHVLNYLSTTNAPPLLGSLLATLIIFAPFTLLLGLVSPFAARLQIHQVKDAGSQVGRIYAAGTIGSIVGTFLTGYLLFTVLGNTRIILSCVIILVITAWLAHPRIDSLLRCAIVVVTLMIIIWPSLFLPYNDQTVLDVDSSYNRILVLDTNINNRPARVLQTDAHGMQSGVYLDGNDLPFKYINAFENVAKTYSGPYLVLGGGAYTLPKSIAQSQPNAQISVVEIDPQLQKVAKQYFNYSPSENTHIFEQDGRDFLEKNQQKYNVVFVDVYNSLSPPFHLTTSEAVAKIRASLTTDGVVAVNVISRTNTNQSFINTVVATYKQHFAYLGAYAIKPVTSDDALHSILLLASNAPIKQFDTDLMSREITIQPTPNVLIDDFAPVEALSF